LSHSTARLRPENHAVGKIAGLSMTSLPPASISRDHRGTAANAFWQAGNRMKVACQRLISPYGAIG
jgi:hypothetical protein